MELMKSEWTRTKDFCKGDFRAVLKTTAIAFAVLALSGFAVGMILPQAAEKFFDIFVRQIQDTGIVQDDGSVSAMALLINNVRASLYTALYGLIPFIFLPALSLGLNSLMLGFFGAYYIHHGLPIMQYIMGILPHGIFELPALVVSMAVGLYLCRSQSVMQRHRYSPTAMDTTSAGSSKMPWGRMPMMYCMMGRPWWM